MNVASTTSAILRVWRWTMFAGIALAAGRANAESGPVDFRRDVQPILKEHCHECHGATRQRGDLRLTSRDEAFNAAESGIPVIVPSDASLSLLYERLRSTDPDERMPKDRDPLSEDQLSVIERWIDEGAEWPARPTAADHWAYQPIQRPVVDPEQPAVDGFVRARLRDEGIAPAGPANPDTLLRRVHLDLTGLPPTPDEVRAFRENPETYEAVVDRLLASPQFGERWAVPWLDLARYADSTGFMSEVPLTNWPYRDWVIDAINADLPFDQFTIEQLAGDLLPNATESQRVATGLHRSSPLNLEAGVHEEDARFTQVVDRVSTTATAWLGSTLACAQCHDHVYDPFSQEDYYRFLAFFNSTPKETRTMGTGPAAVGLMPDGPKLQLRSPETLTAARGITDSLLVSIHGVLGEGEDAAAARWQDDLRMDLYAALQAGTFRRVPPVAEAAVTEHLSSREPEWWRPWLEDMRARLRAGEPQWVTARVTSFEGEGSESHRLEPDGAIRVDGPRPATATYTVDVRPATSRVGGVRIEFPPLSNGSAGRFHDVRAGIAVSELSLQLLDEGAPRGLPIAAVVSSADRLGTKMVRRVLDGDPTTSWLVETDLDQPHWIVAVLETPIELGSRSLRIRLDQHRVANTIGSLRIGTTASDPDLLGMRAPFREALLEREPPALIPARRAAAYRRALRIREPALAESIREASLAMERLPAPPVAHVMEELPRPRDTHLLRRGDRRQPGRLVAPGTPAMLPAMDDTLPRNRLGLALWLVDPVNPLVARVTVNRWWAQLLGRGLVATPEDFGTRGARPTHPELLDWLAAELIDSGWSRKHVVRAIVTSRTYRQSTIPSDPRVRETDPENLLLARAARIRLPAETIRDNALAIAGLLSPKRGGPPVYPPQPPDVWRSNGGMRPEYVPSEGEDRVRRGVYTVWSRTSPYPSFALFGAGNRTECLVTRPRSNTPLQALALLNDEVYVEAATALARRIVESVPSGTPAARIELAFELAVTRRPTATEVRILEQLVSDDGEDEVAAWFPVARAILNLDETITRG